jgi:peroxiredoxin
VRSLVFLVALAGVAHAGAPSNPAFLGISMDDARGHGLAVDGCFVETVTASSAAEAAGLRRSDVIQALDGVPTASCQQLTAEIVAHAPGDLVHLDVIRGAGRVTVHATLSTRAEILHRRLVGHPLESIDAVDVDNRSELDLSELRGETTILAWFDVKRCGDCVPLVRRLGDIVSTPHRLDVAPRMLAVTSGTPDDLASYRTTVNLGVPLAAVDEAAWNNAATSDGDRVFIMVLDRHGTVCFVTPIAPQDDSLDAAIDEVLAAAEQAEHARTRK